jgi:hypothetical protein
MLTIVHWVIPCVWPVICILGLMYCVGRAHNKVIVRTIPKEGFPVEDGGAARVRFWKTEPLRMRQTWKVKAWVGWGLGLVIGLLLIFLFCYVIPYGASTIYTSLISAGLVAFVCFVKFNPT